MSPLKPQLRHCTLWMTWRSLWFDGEDMATLKEQTIWKGHTDAVWSVGKQTASGSGDQTVKLWNVASQTEFDYLRGHRSGVTAMAFLPDGQSLTSAAVDDAIRAWEVAGQR